MYWKCHCLSSECWSWALYRRRIDVSSVLSSPQTELSVCYAQQSKEQLWSTQVALQWQGPHCLNIVVVLAASSVFQKIVDTSLPEDCWHIPPPSPWKLSSSTDALKRQQGYIRSGAVRQPVRFKHLRGMERPVAPHLTRLSSDRGHNRVQNLALK